MVYLDYTAHMPATEIALQALCNAERKAIGNANAKHAAGEEAHKRVQDALARMEVLLHVGPGELVLTSGASESNNTAILGIAYAKRHFGKHILTTPLEHPSVSGCLTYLQEQGYEIEVLPLQKDGQVDLQALSSRIRGDTILLTLCAVDSELGIVQPVQAVSEMLKAHPHCSFHMDATQAIGKIPIDLSLADTAAFSAHKFGGITGSGALYKKKDVEMEPLIHGGVSTTLYRSGTPCVGLACSQAAALEEALQGMQAHHDRVQTLNVHLRKALQERKICIHSPEHAIPYILNCSVPGIKGSVMRDALSAKGVYISVKSACSVDATPSRAVMTVTGSRKQALESFRVSLSHLTGEDEMQFFLEALDQVCQEVRKG